MPRIEEEAAFRQGQKFALEAMHSSAGLAAPKFRQSPEWHLNLDTLGLYNLSWLTLQNVPDIKALVHASGQTLEFIKRAFADQAHLKESMQRNVPKGHEFWNRDLNFLGLYLLSPLNYAEIGSIYGYTRANVQRVVDETIVRLRVNSSSETRNEFPNNSLRRGKVGSGQVIFLKDPQMASAMQEIIDGEAPVLVVRSNPQLPVTRRQILYKRTREIGREVGTKLDEYAQRVDQAEDDEQVAELFEQLGRGFFIRRRDVVMTLTAVTPKIHNKNISEALEVLKAAGVPVKSVPHEQNGRVGFYHFVRIKDASRIKDIVAKSDLKPAQLKVLGPEVDAMPSILDLLNKDKHVRVRDVLKSLGIRPPSSYDGLIGDDCDTTIFSYMHIGYFVPVKNVPKLQEYLKRRLGLSA